VSSARSTSAVLRLVLPAFVGGKLVGLLIPMATVWLHSSDPGHPAYATLVDPFARWDGVTYRDIAEHGYPPGPLDLIPGHPGHLWGFFPGYPMLVRAMSAIIPDTVTAGIVVSAVCELVALVYLAKLIMLERGDADSARFGAWLLALYPYAVFLTALYTESAFLAGATAALYHMRRGESLRAGGAAAFAMAMRVTGLALIPALLVAARWRRGGRALGRDLLAMVIALLPLAGFALYAQHETGDALAYQHVQQSASYGNRTTTFPLVGFWHTWQAATSPGQPASSTWIFGMEVIFGLAGLAAIVVLALNHRTIPISLTVFAAGVWLLGASLTYWLGMPRYTMTMVPLYLGAALLTRRRPRWRVPVLVASAAWAALLASTLGTGAYTG
jgi:hypothetical protein